MCDIIVILRKSRFSRCQKFSGFYSKSRGAETKHNGNKVST